MPKAQDVCDEQHTNRVHVKCSSRCPIRPPSIRWLRFLPRSPCPPARGLYSGVKRNHTCIFAGRRVRGYNRCSGPFTMLNLRSLLLLYLLLLVVLVPVTIGPLDLCCLASNSHAPVGRAGGESAIQHLAHSTHTYPLGIPQFALRVPALLRSQSLPSSHMVLVHPRVIAPPEQPPRVA